MKVVKLALPSSFPDRVSPPNYRRQWWRSGCIRIRKVWYVVSADNIDSRHGPPPFVLPGDRADIRPRRRADIVIVEEVSPKWRRNRKRLIGVGKKCHSQVLGHLLAIHNHSGTSRITMTMRV